jgi:hypothetical protein
MRRRSPARRKRSGVRRNFRFGSRAWRRTVVPCVFLSAFRVRFFDVHTADCAHRRNPLASPGAIAYSDHIATPHMKGNAMHTVRTLQTIAAAVLLTASAASFAAGTTTVVSAGPIPQVIVTAKRLTLHEKIRMTLEDVRDAAKRLAGMQQKSGVPAGNLG